MMNIAWGGPERPELNEAMKQWIESHIWSDGRTLPPSLTMGLFDEHAKIFAGVAFHNYDPWAGVIEISAASESKRWLTRPVLKAIFGYAFNDAGCQMVVARVDPEDKATVRIFKAYGFQEYVVKRLLGRDKDQCVLTLTDDDWKSNKFEKRVA
jgi:RimJ/RimL family protein N-acetyltransferase